ncbi:MAG: GNAT family N-acetyltransferase [Chthoniobacterales bacterium]|nr:GNAT family N-acetyltransferase [Chthoniobacterales bacterium]
MVKEITIRKATNADSAAILDLIFHIWVNENHFEVRRENFPDFQQIEEAYEQAGGLFLVALKADGIIGSIACQQLSDHEFALKRMFVKKSERGCGVAQMLLDHLLKHLAKKHHAAIFYLSTKEDVAIAAKKFYLKNGFRVINRSALPKNFPFFYEDDLLMKRDGK